MEHVNYRKFDGAIGWLIDVHTGKRNRITLLSGYMDRFGRLSAAVFVMKGQVFNFRDGAVLGRDGLEVWVSDRWLKNERTRAMAEWACNPKSERYWAM